MTKNEFLSKIWGYYLMLEKNFIATFQFVEPASDNNDAYSKEYNKLFLSICSEIDVVCKELCKCIEGKEYNDVKNYNIINYKSIISSFNNFMNESCVFSISNEELLPWKEWNDTDRPTWWQNYNHLKHDRLLNDNNKLGNYKNVKEAISALYILCRVLYKTCYSLEPTPKSELFTMKNWTIYIEMGGGFVNIIDEHGSMFLCSHQ